MFVHYCFLAFEFVICVTVHTFVFTWRRKHETQDKNKMSKHASNAGLWRLENGDIDGVGFRGKVGSGQKKNKCPN